MITVTVAEIVNILSINKNVRLIKKVLRQDPYFSTRLQHAEKKIREIKYSMANTTYNSSEDMINKLQILKGEIKLKFYKKINN